MTDDRKRRFGRNASPPTDGEIDEALDESFPASDPPAYTTPHSKEREAVPEDREKREEGRREKQRPRRTQDDSGKT